MYFTFTTSCCDGRSSLLHQKEVEHDRTFTSLSEIDQDARIEEVSRMMSGTEITALTLQHATELLKWQMKEKTNALTFIPETVSAVSGFFILRKYLPLIRTSQQHIVKRQK